MSEQEIAENRLHVRNPNKKPCTGKAGQKSWYSEADDYTEIGGASEKGQFEKIVGEVNDCGHGHGRFHGKEYGHNRGKHCSQAEAGKKGQTGHGQTGETNDEIIQALLLCVLVGLSPHGQCEQGGDTFGLSCLQ